jgi:C4-dicarboxylate-specific signal transduction histidine kinase
MVGSMSIPGQLSLDFPHLRFSPSILARLGEELNPNPDQGLLELVKNAYDADARTCVIELSDISSSGGSVTVSDDGVGMDRTAIEDKWLVLGLSSKRTDEATPLGRLPVGNKGLGRLAALRLGSRACLVSSPREEPHHEYVLDIEWSDYSSVHAVEDVRLSIKRRRREVRPCAGTTITIHNLSQRLQRNDVKRLARGLLLLADPFAEDPSSFRPTLNTPEFDDLSQMVERRYFDDAEFHLIASINGEGYATAKVVDWKGNDLYTADHQELRRRDASFPYECTNVTFDLWTFVLDKETFSTRTSTIQEVQEWLREFGGVHLYIRGFRVSPYGNPGNDWLDLNLSRARSPELRPSTNNAIGRISIADPRNHFVQKTDRSGLIEDAAFAQLKQFAADALNWMAKRRLDERERRRTSERSASQTRAAKSRASVEEVIHALPKKARDEVQTAFDRYDRARDREATTWRKEVQLYRTLSTAGITAALFAHESKHPLQLIEKNIKQVQRAAQEELGNAYDGAVGRPLDRMLNIIDGLRAFGSLTLSQIDNDKRRAKRVEIHGVVKTVGELFRRFIEQRKVQLELQLAGSEPFLRASDAAIESIVTNLLTNSLRAFEKASPGKHLIVIRTAVDTQLCTLRCLDSGPGICDIKPADVWLPGETTYPNGTGLGLTIVRDTVIDLGGTVEAIAHGELGGAEFTVQLPILGS